MLSPAALLKGLVSRILPNSPNPDNQNIDVGLRLGRYGEAAVLSYVRKAHMLADEGSYFIVNNAQTGLGGGTATGFVATTPWAILQNTDSLGGKRMYLDYHNLVATVAGGAASTGVQFVLGIVADTGLRFSSAGTNLTANIVSPNMDINTAKSIAAVYAGSPTATAASAAARTLVGQRTLRPYATAGTVGFVVGDSFQLNFGGVESNGNGSLTVANISNVSMALPPIVIGPQQSVLIYIWNPGATTPSAPSFLPDFGWWER